MTLLTCCKYRDKTHIGRYETYHNPDTFLCIIETIQNSPLGMLLSPNTNILRVLETPSGAGIPVIVGRLSHKMCRPGKTITKPCYPQPTRMGKTTGLSFSFSEDGQSSCNSGEGLRHRHRQRRKQCRSSTRKRQNYHQIRQGSIRSTVNRINIDVQDIPDYFYLSM